MTFGSVRHSRRIHATADVVWAVAGDPTRLGDWFPGVVGCEVERDRRTITLATGLSLPEQILVHDPGQRRFQYTITAPFFAFHRGTLDVMDLGDGSCVVSYAADADPRTMALVIAGAAAAGLDELARLTEREA
jgi:carbon monoxide dehydrogenase subunit G